MPEYQYPGRLDLENKNDGYSAKINTKSSLQISAQQALGITEGSKLYNASRKESNQLEKSAKAPSEKSVRSNHTGLAQTNAQKLDKFIGN